MHQESVLRYRLLMHVSRCATRFILIVCFHIQNGCMCKNVPTVLNLEGFYLKIVLFCLIVHPVVVCFLCEFQEAIL